jgi:hypothetical protein
MRLGSQGVEAAAHCDHMRTQPQQHPLDKLRRLSLAVLARPSLFVRSPRSPRATKKGLDSAPAGAEPLVVIPASLGG